MAALSAALSCALLSMVGHYSLGKGKSITVENKIRSAIKLADTLRVRLTQLVDLDAKAYLKVVAARKKTSAQKKKALKEAQKIPWEVTRLCFKAIDLAPVFVKHGNIYLISDVEVAVELLYAAFNSAMINVEVNQ